MPVNAIKNFLGDLNVLWTAATLKPPASDEIQSLGLLVEQHARSHPNDPALICEDEKLTWLELDDRSSRIARQLKAQGVVKGDCVSLLMQNRVEFVICLLGIIKLGATAGLINTNLTRAPLVHCISLINSKKCIFGEELTEPLNEVRDELSLEDGKDYLFVNDEGDQPPPNWAVTLDSKDESVEGGHLEDLQNVEIGSTAFYIFTSGTTGLPKAAVVSHRRTLPNAMMSAKFMLRINRSDRMYNCLPLYHGTGLMIGLSAAFTVGASTVIRRRLSVSQFWDDIRKYDCTCFVYIGEFIRYLLSRPEQSNDTDNRIKAIVGNGLRPDIWHKFKNRFGIERIGEFYGASEGNGGFANVFNKDCTVGLGVAPVKLVKYDVANDVIIRNDNGFCIEVDKGEPGLLLIEVTSKTQFEGYTNNEASQKKLENDVLKKGDTYFNSGDLMKTVDVGFAFGQAHYQFVDRIGDTFRWKSENVSTNEVGEIINQHSDVHFTNVYGVEIPGTDGRAGMAAIVFGDHITHHKDLDIQSLSDHIVSNLPSYARPIFIRMLKELPTTTTHKLQKNDLRDQAFHLDKVSDELFVMKPGDNVYSRLDSDFYDQIIQRSVAF